MRKGEPVRRAGDNIGSRPAGHGNYAVALQLSLGGSLVISQ
jgi:hypothetical protein